MMFLPGFAEAFELVPLGSGLAPSVYDFGRRMT
jgi:hypothetical protein